MRLHTDFESEAPRGLSPHQLSMGTWTLHGLGNPSPTRTAGVVRRPPQRIIRTADDWTDEECLTFATALTKNPDLRLSGFAECFGAETVCDDYGEMRLRVLERAKRKVEKHSRRIPEQCRQEYVNRYWAVFMDMCGPIRASA